MRLSPQFSLIALLTIAGTALALSIQVERSKVDVREAKTFEYDASGTELMAPHDVELVRHSSWTYKNSERRSFLQYCKADAQFNYYCRSEVDCDNHRIERL